MNPLARFLLRYADAARRAKGDPRAGDLLDELIDPRNLEAVRLALRLKRDGSL